MAQKTRAEILTEINTLLADNTTGAISAEDVRNVFIDIKDSFYNLSDNDLDDIKGYKEALLYITQTGTDAPTISTTIKNDFTNLVFTYAGEGRYSFNSDEDLTGNGVFFQFEQENINDGVLNVTSIRNGGAIYTKSTSSSIHNLVSTNGVLKGYLYIRKYN
jgi:hypothetical protein